MLNRCAYNVALARKGYTNRELAKKIGVSKNTLSAKVTGKAPFNTDEIDSICDELGIVEDAEKAYIFLHNPSQNRDEEIYKEVKTAELLKEEGEKSHGTKS